VELIQDPWVREILVKRMLLRFLTPTFQRRCVSLKMSKLWSITGWQTRDRFLQSLTSSLFFSTANHKHHPISKFRAVKSQIKNLQVSVWKESARRCSTRQAGSRGQTLWMLSHDKAKQSLVQPPPALWLKANICFLGWSHSKLKLLQKDQISIRSQLQLTSQSQF